MSNAPFTSATVPPHVQAMLDDLADPILPRPSAAAFLGVSLATFDRICRRGEGPQRTRVSPRRLGFRLSELRRWATERQGS